jgi:serine/threonine protein phosphatase 1
MTWPTTANARVPDGWRVFAFGDVHGRQDLLAALIAGIEADLGESPVASVAIVGLGDYVDRGPDSSGVFEALLSLRAAHDTRYLKGNHESMFVSFLEDPAAVGRHWFRNGGWETVMSYGVACSPNITNASDFRRVRDDLLARMPRDHVRLLHALLLTATFGDYFFVHAGGRPGVALTDTSEEDALWIRRGFSDRDEPFEKVVVHGHSPTAAVFVGRHRINLDTGAYATGRLSCVVLEGRGRRFIEVTG